MGTITDVGATMRVIYVFLNNKYNLKRTPPKLLEAVAKGVVETFFKGCALMVIKFYNCIQLSNIACVKNEWTTYSVKLPHVYTTAIGRDAEWVGGW